MPADKRFNLRDWLEKFSDTSNTNLRDRTNEVARRLLQLLPGGDPGDLDPPGPPTNLVAFGGVVSVSLTWVAPPDLDVVRYRVQRSTTSGSGFSTITETTDTSLVDSGLTGGTTYYYRVAAIDDAGNVGDYSAEASATATPSGGAGTPPLPPAGVSAVAGDTVITLSWTIGDPTAVSTRVLRGTATGGPYTQVAAGLTGTSWQDTGLTNGTEYFYVLRHVNANGDVSVNSAETSATPFAETNAAPSTPTGFVVTPKYLSAVCVWNANPEADIAGYRVEYGSAPDALSSSVTTTGTTVTIDGLTQAATYYFSLVAIDTAGNESDPVDVTSKVILSGTAPASPTPPATPADFRVHSEGDRTVTFRWTANTELDLARYNLNVYALTNTPSGPGGQGWVSIVANIGPGATEYVLVAPWLENDRTYWFSLSAVNTSGQFSQINAGPVAGTPSAQTGGGGGTYEPPPGGGTGTTPGAFSGDTGLGARHKAPGANFDFVVDRSEYTGPNLFNSIGVALQQLQVQGNNLEGKRIAVLLPSKNYRIQYESNSAQTFNAGRRGIGIGDNQWYQESLSFPNVPNLQLHFIGPYPGADLSATVADAVGEDYEFELSSVTQEGEGWAQGSANQGKGMVSIGVTQLGCRIGFWFTQFNVANWAAVTWGNSNALPYGYLTFYGCRFVQPYHFSNIDSTNFANTGGTNANAFMPRFQISTYGVAIDQFHYNYMDCPYTAEHHIYERNPPIADCYITNSTFLRTGGNIWQQTRRQQVGGGSGSEGPDTSNGQLAGTQYWRNCVAKRWGRSWWSSGAIELKNAHRNLDMEDCDFINDNPGCVAVWPPPNLATIAADEFCSGPYSRNSGNVINDAACSWFLTLGGEEGAPPMTADNHFNGTARLRNVRVYIRQPQDNTFNFACARSVDIEDCVVLQTVTANGVGLVRAGNPCPSPTAFNTFSWRLNNVSGDVAAFKAAYTEVPGSGEVPGAFEYRLPGAGQGTGYYGNGRTGTIITMGGANLTAQIVLPGNFGITQII